MSRLKVPKAPTRTRTVIVRMTVQEHADARTCARSLGVTMSRLMRSRSEVLPPPRADLELAAQFTRIGNNINQIAHAINAGGQPELAQVISALAQLQESLARLRGQLRGQS